MSQCARCFGKSYVIDRKGDRAVASVCSCQLPCPRCGGIGHTYAIQESQFSAKVGKRKYEVLVPCSCNLLKTRVERFNDVDLPGIYARADFDGFSTSAMRPQIVEALKKAKETALRFAMGFNKTNPGRGYVLAGPVGTGKTHLLASTLQHLALELGVRCKYVEISLLYATIRRGFQEGKSGGEIISPLSEIDVLAIDELGKGRGSQFEQETLDELIARRYNAGRTTLFGTNYSLAEPVERSQEGGYRDTQKSLAQASKESFFLKDRVGDRTYSRLLEMCEFVELPRETPDHRRVLADHSRTARP